jgi:hypothetical protein
MQNYPIKNITAEVAKLSPCTLHSSLSRFVLPQFRRHYPLPSHTLHSFHDGFLLVIERRNVIASTYTFAVDEDVRDGSAASHLANRLLQ